MGKSNKINIIIFYLFFLSLYRSSSTVLTVLKVFLSKVQTKIKETSPP